VLAARGDRRHTAREPGDGSGNGAVRVRAVAQLAVVVLAPTVRPPFGRETARVAHAGGDGNHAARQARDGYRRGAPDLRAVAQLPVPVVAPALDGSRGCEPTGVGSARRDCSNAARDDMRALAVAPTPRPHRHRQARERAAGVTALTAGSTPTPTGSVRSAFVPSPTWPAAFEPQQSSSRASPAHRYASRRRRSRAPRPEAGGAGARGRAGTCAHQES
jgi:hypothetical protein